MVCIRRKYLFAFAETEFAVKTKTIAVDFSTCPKAIDIVKEELGTTQVGILGKSKCT